ncbi:MAG TPA: hypothetical protein VFS43_31650 [Polyangiaceae bacterium]|nr:hypothetical protein [Polyangiaceae bacterium]
MPLALRVALWGLLCALPGLAATSAVARGRLPRRPPGPWLAASSLGALGGLGVYWLEGAVRVSYDLGPAAALPLVLTMAVLAPAEEGAKIGALWPALWMGGVPRAERGLALSVAASSGLAAAQHAAIVLAAPELGGWGVLRLALSVPAQALPSALWGHALGRRDPRGRPPRSLLLVWALAVASRGLLSHALTRRTPAWALGALGVLAGLGAISYVSGIFRVRAGRHAPPASGRLSVPPPSSLRQALESLRRRRRPLKAGRVLLGAFALHGALLVAAGSAFAFGGRLGLDMAALGAARETPVGPLAWLVGASLAAFPVGGFLLARASDDALVAEVALAALFAASLFLAHLGLLAPTTLAYGVAGVPAAVALACAGAWYGGRAS